MANRVVTGNTYTIEAKLYERDEKEPFGEREGLKRPLGTATNALNLL